MCFQKYVYLTHGCWLECLQEKKIWEIKLYIVSCIVASHKFSFSHSGNICNRPRVWIFGNLSFVLVCICQKAWRRKKRYFGKDYLPANVDYHISGQSKIVFLEYFAWYLDKWFFIAYILPSPSPIYVRLFFKNSFFDWKYFPWKVNWKIL